MRFGTSSGSSPPTTKRSTGKVRPDCSPAGMTMPASGCSRTRRIRTRRALHGPMRCSRRFTTTHSSQATTGSSPIGTCGPTCLTRASLPCLRCRPFRAIRRTTPLSRLRDARSLAYLFPSHAEFIREVGKEAGDSRIWAGIHYPMDNRGRCRTRQSGRGEIYRAGKKRRSRLA